MCDDLKALLKTHAQVNVQTQIVEDVQGEQTDNSALKACRRIKRPATSMAVAIEKCVVSQRHRFEELQMGTLVIAPSTRISHSAFHAPPEVGQYELRQHCLHLFGAALVASRGQQHGGSQRPTCP